MRLKLLLLSLLFLATPVFGEVNTVATAHRCTTAAELCYAPLLVYFDASESTCNASECGDGWDTLLHEWDFGDPRGETWEISGLNRNFARGPDAFHVFKTPGTYTINVTSRARNGNANNKQITIVVDDPATLATYCVSNSANFTGCPGGATQSISGNFGSEIATAYTAGKRRILFKGGDTFTGAPGSYGAGPVIVGAFGTGKALVTTAQWASITSAESGWTFMDIAFTATSLNTLRVTTASNILMFRISWEGVSSFLEYQSSVVVGNGIVGENTTTDFFNGNSGHLVSGLPCIWPPKSKAVVAGMYFTDCSRLIRQDYDDNVIVSHGIYQYNKLTGKRGHNGIEMRGVEAGANVYLDRILISYNLFGIDDASGCNDCRGIALNGDGNSGPASRHYRTLIENNMFADGTEVFMRDSDQRTVIRNNLFEDHVAGDYPSGRIFSELTSVTPPTPPFAGLRQVYNNTFHTISPNLPNIYTQAVIAITNGTCGYAGLPCEAKNNLIWTTDGVYPAASFGPGANVVSGNATRSPADTYVLSSDPLVNTTPDVLVPAGWEVRPELTNIRGGPTSQYVINDFSNRLRPALTSTVGAMDDGSGTQTPQPPAAPVLR